MTIFSKDFIKDPNAIKDYTIEGADYLGTDTFLTQTWSVPSGITKVTDSITNSSQNLVVWFSGGTAGTDYDCYVTFTTTNGVTDRAMLKIKVR